jgi:hypothetical protein
VSTISVTSAEATALSATTSTMVIAPSVSDSVAELASASADTTPATGADIDLGDLVLDDTPIALGFEGAERSDLAIIACSLENPEACEACQ